jgi:hypothetical protein
MTDSSELYVSGARRLTLEELRQASPHLAHVAGQGFIDAYQGAGGVFVAYTSGSLVFLYTMRPDPTPVEIEDLRWSSEFAIPCARALAACAITPVDSGGTLFVAEEDSDWASEQEANLVERAEPEGLLERWFAQLPWGARGNELDLVLRAQGIWDEQNTNLLLMLGREFRPFDKLNYRFPNGVLSSVDTEASFAGEWSVMEWLEGELRRHFPRAEFFDGNGQRWSAASCRPALEGQSGQRVTLVASLTGVTLLGAATAFQREGRQWYGAVLLAKPP